MTAEERCIIAAQGYLELGMFSEVWRELHSLPSEMLGRAEVLEILALSLMGESRWEEALAVAHRLREERPLEPGGFIHEAYCLHELGRTREALDLLVNGPASLRQRPVYFYNAGCYRARLGDLEGAMQMLKLSFQMDSGLRKSAKRDPDLVELKDRL